MSNWYITAAMEMQVGNPTKKLILIKLADNANDDGICWPSYGTIARHCGVDKRTVMRHIKQLEEMGVLAKKHRMTTHGNSSNVYQLYIPTPTLARGDNKSLGGDINDTRGVTVGSPRGCHPCHPEPSIEPSIEPSLNNTSSSQAKNDKFDEQVKGIFEYWKKTMGKDGKSKLTKKRESKIRARLKDGFSPREICEAIKGCAKSPHHMGQNDTGAIYDDLELICRDDSKIKMFQGIANKQDMQYSTTTAKNIEVMRNVELE